MAMSDGEDVNPFHRLGGAMVTAAVISTTTPLALNTVAFLTSHTPMYQFGFRAYAGFSAVLFISAMVFHSLGDIHEYGGVPDLRERMGEEYRVPEDPMDLLDGEDGGGDE